MSDIVCFTSAKLAKTKICDSCPNPDVNAHSARGHASVVKLVAFAHDIISSFSGEAHIHFKINVI